MNVRYYDIVDQLALGNAEPCSSLKELLSVSDVQGNAAHGKVLCHAGIL